MNRSIAPSLRLTQHWVCAVFLVFVSWLAWAPAAAAAQPLRVMSFNVRLPVEADGDNRWEARRELMARVISHQHPDLIGSQELHKPQGDFLVEQLPEYAWFGRGRRGGDGDEHVGVFYRTRTLRLIESGDFWLSDTPDVAGSITWGNLYPRLVTWGLFEQKPSGRRFYLYNTHLPYREEDGQARERAATLILAHLATLPADTPVILMGDFNDVPTSRIYAQLTAKLRDAWTDASKREGPAATFHDFTGRAVRRIDWVLARGLHARRARTVTDAQDGRYPSDHFPVVVDYR